MKIRMEIAIGAMLVVLSVAGFAIGVVHFAPVTTTVTVTEAISISPASATISLFPDECAPLEYSLTNSGNADVTVTWSASVTGAPPDGSAADVTLTPSDGTVTVTAHTTTALDVIACASNGIVPGDYTITATFQRA